jgi:hypothetical protein
MKSKILNLLLIVTSLFGYLEWSGNNHIFLFKAEAEIFLKLFSDPIAVLHPFIMLPLISQLILLITLFQNPPNRILTYISIAGLGLLLLFMFAIGLITGNVKTILSTIPFLIVAVLAIRYYRNIDKPVQAIRATNITQG